MSDFDSNPFADPDFSNPFQVADDANYSPIEASSNVSIPDSVWLGSVSKLS